MNMSDDNKIDINDGLDRGILLETKPKIKKPSMYNVLY